MEFRHGDAVAPLAAVGEAGEKRGTEVSFLPSTETFSQTEFDYATLEKRLRELAFLNSGVRIVLSDNRHAEKRREELVYEGGVEAFVRYLDRSKAAVIEKPIVVRGERDGIALEGIRLVSKNLARAVSFARRVGKGDEAARASVEHLEARGMMLNAAMMGGVAFQKGLGVTHSLAHALSTVCDVHHGLANGVVLPVAMAFNRPVVADRLADCGAAAGASRAGADGFIAWIEALKAEIGIPRTLAEAGVGRAHLDRLVAVAVKDPCHGNNPRPVREADFRAMFEEAGLGA